MLKLFLIFHNLLPFINIEVYILELFNLVNEMGFYYLFILFCFRDVYTWQLFYYPLCSIFTKKKDSAIG